MSEWGSNFELGKGYNNNNIMQHSGGGILSNNITNPNSGISGGNSDSWISGISNGDALGGVMSGVETLGNLYLGFQANKRAKEQMRIAQDQWNRNWNSQAKAYNTRLENKQRAGYSGLSQKQKSAYDSRNGSVEGYVAKNKIDKV